MLKLIFNKDDSLKKKLALSRGAPTTSNIGVSIISLNDTPRLHTLKRVIRNLIVWRTYNESSKLTLGFIHQNPIKKQKIFVAV